MGHPRRMYSTGTVYFVTNRVAEGLPFVPNAYIRLLLFGVVARASARFEGITICAWLFMANHYHAVLILNGEPAEFAEFMNFVDGEIAKLVVKWLGKRNVKVWGQRYHAAPLLTSEDVLDRMTYLFMNPVKARLVTRASDWEGASTFYSLERAIRSYKRILPGRVSRLPKRNFSKKALARLEADVAESDASEYELKVDCFAWMDCFRSTRGGCRDSMHQRLYRALAEQEAELLVTGGRKVVGARALSCANPHRPFRPRKRGRRVACISQNWELRRRFMQTYRAFCIRAQWAWRDAIACNKLPTLPPGAFCAPKPFRCCLLPSFSP